MLDLNNDMKNIFKYLFGFMDVYNKKGKLLMAIFFIICMLIFILILVATFGNMKHQDYRELLYVLIIVGGISFYLSYIIGMKKDR